jgi:hypothetical protein
MDDFHKLQEKRNGLWVADPVAFATELLGIRLLPFQEQALNMAISQGLLNCSRQAGKTLAMSIKAVHLSLAVRGMTIAVMAPTERQVGQFFLSIRELLRRLGVAVERDGVNRFSAVFPNGSRIVGLPAGAEIRGLSAVNLLIIDEAAKVPDEAYHTVTPMLATTFGKGAGGLWLLSTPNGKTGFFYYTWEDGGDAWTRLSVPASSIPRISPEFLKVERERKGDAWFRQEYCCEFLDTADALFREDRVRRAIKDSVPPLWN